MTVTTIDRIANIEPASSSQDKRLADHVFEIRRLGKRVINDIIEIGRRLIECREILRELYGHGHWYDWLDKEFGWSKQTALNFVRVYEMSKCQKFVDFNFDLPASALYLIAAPTTSETVRTEVIERARAGEKVFVADVKKAIAGTRTNKVPKTINANPVSDVVNDDRREPVEAKNTGEPTRVRRTRAAVALENFDGTIGFVSTACTSLDDVSIPPLDPERVEKALSQLKEAIASVRAFRKRIEVLPAAQDGDPAASAEARKEFYRESEVGALHDA
jgi:hypothetical protein